MDVTRTTMSICIPVYNGADYIRHTLNSALGQTHRNIEVIVVNNSSTDGTTEILAEYKDSRLRVLTNEVTVPPSSNWTKAVRHATGDWTKLLCADDVLAPTAVEDTLRVAARHPNALVVAGSRSIIDPSGMCIRSARSQWKEERLVHSSEFSRRVCLSGSNPLGEGLVVAWQTRLTEKVGSFSPEWHYFIDLDFWLRLTTHGLTAVTPQPMGSFRISPGSWTSQIGLSNIEEAKRFFLTHPHLLNQPKIIRRLGFAKSIGRSLARTIFSAAHT